MPEATIVRDYCRRFIEMLQSLPIEPIEQVVEILWRARAEGRTVFLCGNGGSAATASHLACDLGKGTARPGLPRLRVVALTDNVATMTAYGNDLSYQDIFVEPLINLFRPDDVLIGISGSGNSENVLRAARYVREHGGVAIGFTGYQGGKLRDLTDPCVVVPSDDLQHIEDVHLILGHMLMQELCRRIVEEES